MDIPVLLEPTPTGWRASTGAPLNLVAEGTDKDAVLADVRAQADTKLSGGATVVSLSVPVSTLDIVAIRALAAELASDPIVADWARATQEYRDETNTIPDADEPAIPAPVSCTDPISDSVPAARP